MKKILPFLLASILLTPISFAQKKDNTPRDTLNKISEKGVIVLAVRESSIPFSYYDANGNTIGYTVELCERVAKKIRKNLNLPSLKIVYLPVEMSERMDVVKKGIADIECGVTTNTEERQKSVDFSIGIFAVETRFVTDKSFSFKDVQELNGKQVSVSEKSIGESYIASQKKDRSLTYKVHQYKDTKEGMLAVLEGTSQAHPDDDILLVSQIAFNPNMKDKLHVTGNSFAPNTYGLVLPKGDIKFKREVDNILKELIHSGEAKKIYNKWFLSPIPPKNINIDFPMNETTKEIFTNPTDAAFIEK